MTRSPPPTARTRRRYARSTRSTSSTPSDAPARSTASCSICSSPPGSTTGRAEPRPASSREQQKQRSPREDGTERCETARQLAGDLVTLGARAPHVLSGWKQKKGATATAGEEPEARGGVHHGQRPPLVMT